MLYIRQNATHKVVIGPAVAVGDGFTPVTDLDGGGDDDLQDVDEASAILHDNGTIVDLAAYTFAAITNADGYYHLTLQAAISGTVGHMTVVIRADSEILPMRADFTIIEEAAYDVNFKAAAEGALQGTTQGQTLDVSATGEAGLDFNNIKNATGAWTLSNITVPVATAVTDQVTADVTAIHGGGLSEGTHGYLAAAFTKLFDVASPTATCLSLPDAVPGAAGGGFIAGTNAETTVTTAINANLIGNITGNLSGSVGSVSALAANVITAASINADAITNAKIANDAIAAENLKTGALSADAFAADAIVAATFATDAITSDALAASALTEIQSSCNSALVANNLDHLALTACDSNDITLAVNNETILACLLAADGDISEYNDNSHSLEAIADEVSLASGARYAPDSDSTITTGTEDYGTYASCASDNGGAINDGNRWEIGDSDKVGESTLEVICEFNMGAGRIARQVDVNGFYNRNGAGGWRVLLYAYNYTTSAWDALQSGTSNTEMRDRSSDKDYVWELDAAYTDIVTTPGEVKVKFQSTREDDENGDVLYLDYVSVVGSGSASVSPEAIAQAVHTELDNHLKHIPLYTGNIHYVSKAGDDTNSGHVPDAAFLTMGAAITASGAGDQIIIKAGTYDEASIDLNLNSLEVHCEVGTIFKDTGGGTVLTISADNVVVEKLDVQPESAANGIDVTGEYVRLADVYVHKAHTKSYTFSVNAEHAYLTHCRCDNFSTTGYEVAAPEMLMDQCYALGKDAPVKGYHLLAGATYGFYVGCVSIDCTTASFDADSGANDNLFLGCADSDGCGAVVDGGTDNAWRGFGSADLASVNAVQVIGV